MKKTLFLAAVLFFTRTPEATEANDFSVSASPSLIPIQASAPINHSSEIQITNHANTQIQVNIRPIEFQPDQKWDGSISLSSTQPLHQANPTLSSYITIREYENEVSSVTLQAGQQKNITLQINVPEQAKQQDFYFTLLFEKENVESEEITIQPSIATNILLSISPITTKSIHIQEFTAPQLVTDSTTSFRLLLENTGESYTSTNGEITIENMFGTVVKTIPLPQHFVLAEGKRYITDSNAQNISWNPRFMFGWYKATAHIDTKEKTVTASTYFISLPAKIITGTSISLIFILGIYLRVRKKI